jgi:hypothetical protein
MVQVARTATAIHQTAKEGVREMFVHAYPPRLAGNAFNHLTQPSGQALVEFTFTFLILLIVAWIPADFGLAVLYRPDCSECCT